MMFLALIIALGVWSGLAARIESAGAVTHLILEVNAAVLSQNESELAWQSNAAAGSYAWTKSGVQFIKSQGAYQMYGSPKAGGSVPANIQAVNDMKTFQAMGYVTKGGSGSSSKSSSPKSSSSKSSSSKKGSYRWTKDGIKFVKANGAHANYGSPATGDKVLPQIVQVNDMKTFETLGYVTRGSTGSGSNPRPRPTPRPVPRPTPAPKVKIAGCQGCPKNFAKKRKSRINGKSYDKVTIDEYRVLEITNKKRKEGFTCPGGQYFPPNDTPMTYDCRLWWAAKLHSQDMAKRNYYSHINPDGMDHVARAEKWAFGMVANSENVIGLPPWHKPTPEQAVDAWLNSDSHCKGLGDPKNKLVGVGKAKCSTGSCQYPSYWTMVFTTKGTYNRNNLGIDSSCYSHFSE